MDGSPYRVGPPPRRPFSNDPVMEPFIPPGVGDDEPEENKPVVPNALISLKPYRFRRGRNTWKHVKCDLADDEDGESRSVSSNVLERKRRSPPSNIRIVTWNIDMRAPLASQRLREILRYLELQVLVWRGGSDSGNSSDDSENGENGRGRFATVVMLQEMSEEAFAYLLKDDWVRRMFAVVPRDPRKWPENATYGNVTLVSRDLEVINAYILHFTLSQQARTGVAVNIRVAVPGTKEKKIVCLVNTHLESLPEGEPLRPEQLGVLTKFLKQRGIEGGIIAGDMNAINPKVDRRSVGNVGLKDAWRKSEKDPEGYTWGFQRYPDDGDFPPNRLDKVLYLPRRSYKVDSPECIGIGLKIESPVHGSIWASDHFGLLSAIHVVS